MTEILNAPMSANVMTGLPPQRPFGTGIVDTWEGPPCRVCGGSHDHLTHLPPLPKRQPPLDPDLSREWFVVLSNPREEGLAHYSIAEKGFQPYLPQLITASGKVVPYFTRYLFVHLNLEHDPWRHLCAITGVRRILAVDQYRPIPIPSSEIAAIKRLENKDGVIDGRPVAPPPPPIIAPGTKLRVTDGPLVDWRGLCIESSERRVIALLGVLQRRTELRRDQVEPI